MNERIRELAEQAGYQEDFSGIGHWDMPECKKFAELVRQDERQTLLVTIDELMGMEADRHKMFSEGYDYALYHIRQSIEGRSEK